jgi:hypothetical protein
MKNSTGSNNPTLAKAPGHESFQSLESFQKSSDACDCDRNAQGVESLSKRRELAPSGSASAGLPVGQGNFSGSSLTPYVQSSTEANFHPGMLESVSKTSGYHHYDVSRKTEIGYIRKTRTQVSDSGQNSTSVSKAQVSRTNTSGAYASAASSAKLSTAANSGKLASNMHYSKEGRRKRASTRKYEKYVWEYEICSYAMLWMPEEPGLVDQDGKFLDAHQFKGIESGWVLIIDDGTDESGWTYASKRDRHDEPRANGVHRKDARFGDVSRRRRWVPPSAGKDGVVKVKASAVRASYEQQLLTVLKSIMTRHLQKHNVMGVLDPISMLTLREPHQKYFEETCSAFPPYTDVSIVSRAALCSMFARAAYGQSMKLGYINDVTTFVKGAIHEDRNDRSLNVQAYISMTGIAQSDVLSYHFSDVPFEATFVVHWYHPMKWCVVSVRGSLDITDVGTDLCADSAKFLGGFAHRGMIVSATFIWKKINKILSIGAQEHPDYALVFTGHSLGAAVSSIVCAGQKRKIWAPPLTHDFKNMFSIGVGSPACFTREVARWCEPFIYSVSRNYDFASRISVMTVDRLLMETSSNSMWTKTSDWTKSLFGGASAAESQAQREKEVFERPASEYLELPGTIIHMYRPNLDKKAELHAKAADPSFFQRVLLLKKNSRNFGESRGMRAKFLISTSCRLKIKEIVIKFEITKLDS